jgi:hypothetical protein
MNINDSLSAVTSSLKEVISLGLTLVFVALVVDLLFPGTTYIVTSVSGLVTSFTSQGLVGLISLIVFVAIYNATD